MVYMPLDLFNYYGLDWLSMLFGFYGLWLLGKKKKISFLFTAAGMCLALVVALIANQYGFMVANSIMIFIALRNYRLWYLEEKAAKQNDL